VLGWEDPHIVTGGGCDWPGCNDWTCCGLPTPDGYKRLCSRHYEEMARIIQETEDRTWHDTMTLMRCSSATGSFPVSFASVTGRKH